MRGLFYIPKRMSNLESFLLLAGDELRNLCIASNVSITVSASNSCRVLMASPPVYTAGMLGKLNLAPLGALTYPHDADLPALIGVMEYVSRLQIHDAVRKDVLAAVRKAVPGIDFTEVPGHSSMCHVFQAMQAAAWSGGLLRYTKGTLRGVTLDSPMGRFSFQGHGYESLGNRYRMTYSVNFPPEDALRQPLRRMTFSHPKLGALYLHLMTNLPDWADAIELVFQAAHHAGLTAPLAGAFDILGDYEAGVDPRVGVWAKAYEALAYTDRFPREALRAILKDVLNNQGLNEFVGAAPSAVRQYTRAKFRKDRLLLLRHHQAHIKKLGLTQPTHSPEAEEMFKLMRSLR